MNSKLSHQHWESPFWDTVADPMTTQDLELQIQWANHAAGETLNEDPENLRGEYCYQVWRGRESLCENCPVMWTIQTGEPQESELESLDGRHWLVKSYPLFSEGTLEGVTELTLEITGRKLAEEERNRNAENQQILLDNIQTQVWYLIDERTYGAVNQAHAEFQGLTVKDMSFQDLFDLYPEDVAEICRQGNTEVFSKGQPVPTEEWVPHASGERRLLSIQKMPKLRADGTVEYVVCSAEDITERKQAEEALRESEERYRLLFEHSPLGVLHANEKGVITSCNNNFVQIIGSSRQDLVGLNMLNLPDKKLVAELQKALQGGIGFYEDVYHSVTANKSTPVRVHFAPIGEKEGRITGCVGIIEDITSYKQAEWALQESEERYRKLINTSPDAIALVDEHGRFLTVNPAMAQRFDLSPEELEGKTYHEVMPKDVADKRITDAKKSLNDEELVCIEDERQDRYLQNYYVPLATSDNLRTFQIISRDITEQKKAEEKFRTLFESANDAIFLMQEDQFIECNTKTLEMFNCTREQILGKPPYLFSPEIQPDGRYSRDKAIEKINSCLQGEPQFFEWRHSRYDGTPFEAEVSLNQVKLGQGVFVQAIVRDITQRKQMEKELRESKEFSSALMDNAPYPIVVISSESSIIYVNSALENLTGFTSTEVVGKKPPFPWWTKESLQQIEKDFQKMFYEALQRAEHWFQKKNGEIFCVEINATKLLKENGEVTYYLSNWVDITERKRAEEALRQSENYYRTIFETSGSAMFIIEENTTISQINSNFERQSGYSKQEVEGKKSWTEFVHPDDVVWMKEYHYLRRREPRATPLSYEFRFLVRSGEVRHGYLEIDMIPGTTQSVVSLIDITDRKQAEEALRQSENYYRALFETSCTAMFILDQDTTISQINSIFEELTGYTRQEIEGKKSWTELTHPDDVAWIKENNNLRSQDLDDALRQYEFRYFTRHGEKRNLLLTVDKIPETKRMIASGIDITERKQMEEKLREMSLRDSLTGLYNRNFFEEEMKRLSDGRRNPLGIIVCDLDGLKFINDTLGHQSGDQMLITIADILRGNFRSSDIIARIGGDEFAVLLTDTDQEMVELMLHRLRKAMQDYNSADPEIPLSLSMGHALGEGETADMHALFREADNRMYREKIQGEGSARSAILQALTGTMQARDFHTEGHCDRLQELAASLARSLDLSQDLINDLFLLARFHDLGKVGVPDHILFKSGPLTKEEWRQMRQHCEIGHRIASSVSELEPIADIILKHHEWWDGRGYPLGLSGRDIPLACRILAIVEAFDAMTSDRPYRKAMTREEAIAELKRCSGTQFDPELVERLIGLW